MPSIKFPHLFSEGQIGKVKIRNRTVMSPMGTGHSGSDNNFSPELIEFYARRAKGGIGMIITEGNVVQTDIDPFPVKFRATRLDGPDKIVKLADLADMVRYYDGVPCAQLSIGMGRQADAPALRQPVAPSPCAAQGDPSVMCRELTVAEIKKLVDNTARAAEYALTAGIQVVEIHGHTGYLLDQFMSPDINKRTDEYGGSLEGRLRLAKEIREAIYKRVGQALPVTFRVTVDHKVEGFRTLSEGLEICKMLEAFGYDGLHVDAGRYEAAKWLFPSAYLGMGCISDLSRAVKQQVKIPVINVGNYTRPEVAEQAIANGRADFIAMGRTLLADPEWANKARMGQDAEIRPCIICNEMCVGRLFAGKSITCSVNPECGRETMREFNLSKVDRPRRVTIVGGGPAGMKTALVASKRGHQVTLLEKNAQLGGQVNLGDAEPFKFAIRDFNNYMKNQMDNSSVDIQLNTPADIEALKRTSPDVVVVATGANVFIPPIKGFDDQRVMTVEGLGRHPISGTENVIVVGAGLVGSEAALGLSLKGCQVTLIEMMANIANDLQYHNRLALLDEISKRDLTVLTKTKCKEISGDYLICTGEDDQDIRIPFDLVITATGTRPNTELTAQINENFPEVYVIGDCVRPGKIGEAIHKGYITGTRI